MNAAEFAAEYEAKLRQEGARAVIAEMRKTLFVQYESRFGPVPENVRQAIDGTVDSDRLIRWAVLVATATQEQVAAQIEAAHG